MSTATPTVTPPTDTRGNSNFAFLNISFAIFLLLLALAGVSLRRTPAERARQQKANDREQASNPISHDQTTRTRKRSQRDVRSPILDLNVIGSLRRDAGFEWDHVYFVPCFMSQALSTEMVTIQHTSTNKPEKGRYCRINEHSTCMKQGEPEEAASQSAQQESIDN
ncbi:hypothetical protein VTL71DRAFT_6696 [Oculimacula yallundae]|uniref:Uncharacterized protein n=1 Tax=Oculimacula yallundae TaxID=86028 RepID=A0ABR4BXP7_9HELO